YLYAWPRKLWRTSAKLRNSAWIRLGWAPAVVVLLMAAALLPSSLPATPAILALAILIAYWAMITGEIERLNRAKMIWWLNLIVMHGFLLSWWLLVVRFLPGRVSLQLSIALLAGIIASSFGAKPLFQFWIDRFDQTQRITSLLVMAGLLV